MLSGLRETKFAEIDQKAARQKAAAEYIVNLIEENESLFRGAFFGDNPEPDNPAATDEALYEQVEETIKELAHEYTVPNSDRVYRSRPRHSGVAPAEQLGWAIYELPDCMSVEELPDGDQIPPQMRLTETGINVINGLRATLELPSLEDQRLQNRLLWQDLAGRPI